MRRVGCLAAFVVAVVQVMFLAWCIATATTEVDCDGLSYEACQTARHLDPTIGVGMVIVLWVACDLALAGLIWLVRLLQQTR